MRDPRRWIQREPKDLRGRPLAGVSMAGRWLFDADLRAVEAEGACFDRAMLEGARFDGAILAGASLRNAHMAHAKFRDTDLVGADLGHDRDKRDLRSTANYADFSRALLDGARLDRTPLTYARLDGASLVGADANRATLVAASLVGADLRGVNLRFADLSRARLEGADLRGADLGFTDLSGANLEGAVVDAKTSWRGTRYNQRTRWFDGARRKAPIT